MEGATLKEAQEKSETESQVDKKAESESQTLLYAALERIDQMERDQAAARQLQREIEAEDAAQLAEQERAARELQRQLEEEEQQAMAEIRAAQERDASIPARAPAPAKPAPKPQPAHAEVQKRLSLDVDTWGLVLQLSEMGFGEDFERLNTVLVQSKMDVSAAADALIASGMPQ